MMDGSQDATGTSPTLPGPVGQSDRILSLDVLRGFALLGILVVNVQSFSMISAAYMNPTAYGDLSGANYWAWLVTHVFFDTKFMTIFSMLFGAGIVLMAERAEKTGRSAAGLHCRRMLWLMLFGLLHAHLVWYGDILFLYGVCGLVVCWFRRLSPVFLLGIGFVFLSIGTGISFVSGWSMPYWPEEPLTEITMDWQPPSDVVDAEVAAFRGGWLEQMTRRIPAAIEFETLILLVWGIWRAGGLMLVGMALFKLGVFSAERSKRFYLSWVAAAALIGVPVILCGVRQNFAADWDVRYSFFFGPLYNYWAGIVVSLGYVGLVMLACRSGVAKVVRRVLAAVGQTALSNYLFQSIVCTTVFYGHGLGLFGAVERGGQLGIAVAVWLLQLVVSPIWMRQFRFGPFEWAWRTLTYLRWQPMRRVSQ